MTNIDKKITTTAAVLAAITIAIGAFGAHGLKQIVDAEALSTFETGVRYQMYHVLGLLAVGIAPQITSRVKKQVCWLFIAGILFFSGSIFVLALQSQFSFSVKFLGPVTPLGGLLLMAGWLRLAVGFYKNSASN